MTFFTFPIPRLLHLVHTAQQDAQLQAARAAVEAQIAACGHPRHMGDIIDVEAVDITDQVRLTYEGKS